MIRIFTWSSLVQGTETSQAKPRNKELPVLGVPGGSARNTSVPNPRAPFTAYFTVYFDRSSRGLGHVSCIDSSVSQTCFAMT